MRKLDEHKVKLPPDYLGFLLTMSLQLTQEEVKLLLNYTQGSLTAKAVKEWVRVHETDLDIKSGLKKTNAVMHLDGMEAGEYGGQDEDGEVDEGLEVLLNAMDELEGHHTGDDEGIDFDGEAFDEIDTKEILATMIKDHAKGGFRRTFKAVADAKKAKHLARGYAAGRDGNGRFSRGPGEAVRTGGTYRISIEQLKKRTKCAKCGKVGHWHRECPEKSGNREKESHFLDCDEAHFVHQLDLIAFRKMQNEKMNQEKGPTAVYSGAPEAKMDRAYMCAGASSPFEVWYLNQQTPLIDEDYCATVDTGCQRTAIGSSTLQKILAKQPGELQASYVNQEHLFRSVNGLSKTEKVACLPTSLGQHGCILRPAVFEQGVSARAPFLLSLPFLLHCRATLVLDPEQGLRLRLRRFGFEVPMHIGPTGALRVPLDQFDNLMIGKLKNALKQIGGEQLQASDVVQPAELHEMESCSSSSPDRANGLTFGPSVPSADHGRPADQANSRQPSDATGDRVPLAKIHPPDACGRGELHPDQRDAVSWSSRSGEPPQGPGAEHDPHGGDTGARGHCCDGGRGDPDQRPRAGGRMGPGVSEGASQGSSWTSGGSSRHSGLLRGDRRGCGHVRRPDREDLPLQHPRGGPPNAEGESQSRPAVLPLPEVDGSSQAMCLLPMATGPPSRSLEGSSGSVASSATRSDLSSRRGPASPPFSPTTTPSPNNDLEDQECKHLQIVGTGSNAWVKQTKCRQCGKILSRSITEEGKAYYARRGLVPPTPKTLSQAASSKNPPTPKPTAAAKTPGRSPGTPIPALITQAAMTPKAAALAPTFSDQDLQDYQDFLRFKAMQKQANTASSSQPSNQR